ncbi:MAG: hypothetical protein H0X21_07430 [Actinobacteria bacterium]|nr:hypothetical protein [Actinomycetota bacterium]
MDAWMWIVLAVVAVAVLVVGWSAMRSRRSKQLQEGFGPEYEHVVEETGDKRDAERELRERRDRREELEIQPLTTESRERYAEEWRTVQGRFVDEPDAAVRDADRLVQQVMAERGYPVADDFERRAADVSVDYPDVVENFREGHRLVNEHEAGDSGTEPLRQAMVHFRSLFDELLAEEPVHEEARQ